MPRCACAEGRYLMSVISKFAKNANAVQAQRDNILKLIVLDFE